MNEKASSSSSVRVNEQTAFVLGNGPSLAAVSLSLLDDYAAIGLNAAYRYWREIDWRPRYYACVDLVVGISHQDEIAALIEEGRIEKFLLRNNLIEGLGGKVRRSDRIVNFDALREESALLSVNPPTTGSHAALWAGEMGYRQIVMLGVDARYKEFVEGSAKREGIELEIVEKRNNPNYFFQGYQQPGDRYNIPNPRPDLHVNAWRQAIARLEQAGIAVFNGNPQSAVQCAPFISLDRFLTDGDRPRPRTEAPPTVESAHTAAPAAATETGARRLRGFVRRYGLLAILALALTGAAIGGWIAWMKPQAPLAALTAATIALILGLSLFILYVREAVLRHLRRLDREFAALKARVEELERRQ